MRDREVEALLGLGAGRLKEWRYRFQGPKWQANPDTGRCMGYRVEDVQAWLDRGHTDPHEERRRRLGYAS